MITKKKVRIGIIMGGPSAEYEISLASGETVYQNLDRGKYEPVKIKILKNRKVLLNNKFSSLEKAIKNTEICFLATHGEFGEDGRLQAILEFHKVPYTGSGVLASALAMNKMKSRKLFKTVGLSAPKSVLIKKGENFVRVSRFPVVVKPCSRGSSVGVSIVTHRKFLLKAIKKTFKYDSEILIEKYINGREFSCGIFETKIGNKLKITALPLTEIIPKPKYKFFSYEAKYKSEATEEITPAQISKKLTKTIQKAAIKAHRILSCKDYSRADFKVINGKVYILELNTLPGLTTNSIMPKQLEVAGWSLRDFLDSICSRNLP